MDPKTEKIISDIEGFVKDKNYEGLSEYLKTRFDKGILNALVKYRSDLMKPLMQNYFSDPKRFVLNQTNFNHPRWFSMLLDDINEEFKRGIRSNPPNVKMVKEILKLEEFQNYLKENKKDTFNRILHNIIDPKNRSPELLTIYMALEQELGSQYMSETLEKFHPGQKNAFEVDLRQFRDSASMSREFNKKLDYDSGLIDDFYWLAANLANVDGKAKDYSKKLMGEIEKKGADGTVSMRFVEEFIKEANAIAAVNLAHKDSKGKDYTQRITDEIKKMGTLGKVNMEEFTKETNIINLHPEFNQRLTQFEEKVASLDKAYIKKNGIPDASQDENNKLKSAFKELSEEVTKFISTRGLMDKAPLSAKVSPPSREYFVYRDAISARCENQKDVSDFMLKEYLQCAKKECKSHLSSNTNESYKKIMQKVDDFEKLGVKRGLNLK